MLSAGAFTPIGNVAQTYLAAAIGSVTNIGSGLLTYVAPQSPSSQAIYHVFFLPSHGTLLLDGQAVALGTDLTQQEIDEGRLSYAQDNSLVVSDQFGFFLFDPFHPGGSPVYVNVTMTGTRAGQVLTSDPTGETLFTGIGNNFFFGDGSTTVSYANSPNGVNIDLVHGSASNGYGGTDKLTNVQSIIGSSHNDVIISDSGFNLSGGLGADSFAFGAAALADAKAGIFDRIADYDQANGTYTNAEGDLIDLSALLSIAFQSGKPVSSIVRALELANSAMVQINPDGTGFVTIAQLNGLHLGDNVNIILDGSQSAGATIMALAGPSTNPSPSPGTTADIVLRRSDGTFQVYNIGSNAILANYSLGQVASGWEYAGLGRFFGTDSADMMLRNSATGAFQVYDTINNNVTATALLGQVGLDWKTAGFGHFMAGGAQTDMMLTLSNNAVTLFEAYGISDNKITTAGLFGRVGTEWQVAGFGPGNGTTDMVVKRTDPGNVITYGLYHDIKNNQFNDFSVVGKVGSEWNVVGFADLAGTGTSDMIVRRAGDNAFGVYHDINDNRFTAFTLVGPVGSEWQVMGFGPIAGAGRDEMLVRRSSDGMFGVYAITNDQFSFNFMGPVGTDWQFDGIAAAGPASASAQLVQGMASFGSGSGAGENLNAAPLAADTSQQTFLTTAQHA
jgi:Cadherin-like